MQAPRRAIECTVVLPSRTVPYTLRPGDRVWVRDRTTGERLAGRLLTDPATPPVFVQPLRPDRPCYRCSSPPAQLFLRYRGIYGGTPVAEGIPPTTAVNLFPSPPAPRYRLYRRRR